MENSAISPTVNGDTTRGIMIDTIIALLPALAGGVMIFGWSVLLQVAVCATTAVVLETVWSVIFKETISAASLSSVATGLLIGLLLPPGAPLWIGGLGSAVAIIIKQLFNLLGRNLFNPVVAARIILVAVFPNLMAKWVDPCIWMNSVTDAVTSPTPLAEGAEIPSYISLFLGLRGGCIGEVCIMLLLCGGIYLAIRRVINPIIPLAFMSVVAIGAFAVSCDPLVYLMSGGVVLGALFIATDYTTGPKTQLGMLIYGIGCGLLTVLIRQFTPFPEGVAFAVLIMSALSPFIDKLILLIPKKGKIEVAEEAVENIAEKGETEKEEIPEAAEEDNEKSKEAETPSEETEEIDEELAETPDEKEADKEDSSEE